jgi:hypothetical protein
MLSLCVFREPLKGRNCSKTLQLPYGDIKEANCYSNILIKDSHGVALIDSFSEFKDDKLIDRVTLMNFRRCI